MTPRDSGCECCRPRLGLYSALATQRLRRCGPLLAPLVYAAAAVVMLPSRRRLELTYTHVPGSGPTAVLVLSLCFIGFVVMLHIWCAMPLAPALCTRPPASLCPRPLAVVSEALAPPVRWVGEPRAPRQKTGLGTRLALFRRTELVRVCVRVSNSARSERRCGDRRVRPCSVFGRDTPKTRSRPIAAETRAKRCCPGPGPVRAVCVCARSRRQPARRRNETERRARAPDGDRRRCAPPRVHALPAGLPTHAPASAAGASFSGTRLCKHAASTRYCACVSYSGPGRRRAWAFREIWVAPRWRFLAQQACGHESGRRNSIEARKRQAPLPRGGDG